MIPNSEYLLNFIIKNKSTKAFFIWKRIQLKNEIMRIVNIIFRNLLHVLETDKWIFLFEQKRFPNEWFEKLKKSHALCGISSLASFIRRIIAWKYCIDLYLISQIKSTIIRLFCVDMCEKMRLSMKGKVTDVVCLRYLSENVYRVLYE